MAILLNLVKLRDEPSPPVLSSTDVCEIGGGSGSPRQHEGCAIRISGSKRTARGREWD